MKRHLFLTALGLGCLAVPALAEIQPHQFKVIGTWGNLASWNDLEKPFWSETLPNATGGALSAEAIPITEAGLKGGEVMRLLSQGVFEVAHGL